nr:PREDICTED: DNA-directed RNA polymerase III subunit RPC4-like [Bemisia tabaci]
MSGKEDTPAPESKHVHRLPSFRSARDLNLDKYKLPTAKPNAKKYVPNLNVTRKKQDDEKGGTSSTSKENDKKQNGIPQRGRGRGRGRGASNLVQTKSIFSEGMGDRKGAKYMKPCDVESVPRTSTVTKSSFSQGHSRGSRDRSSGTSKSRKEHGERLPDDDFIDDVDEGGYEYSFMKPVSLPLRLSENYALEDICDDEEIAPGVKIKAEPGTPKVKVKSENKPRKEFTNVKELLSDSKPQLLFLQLPTNLPGLLLDDKADTPSVIHKEKPIVIKKEPGTEDKQSLKAEPSTSSNSSQSTKPNTAQEAKSNLCTLKELQPGCIGKIQILKSGKAKLNLGSCNFLVDLGSQVGFKQDLVSLELNADTKTGDTINLGPLSSRLIISPEWEDMIKSSIKK